MFRCYKACKFPLHPTCLRSFEGSWSVLISCFDNFDMSATECNRVPWGVDRFWDASACWSCCMLLFTLGKSEESTGEMIRTFFFCCCIRSLWILWPQCLARREVILPWIRRVWQCLIDISRRWCLFRTEGHLSHSIFWIFGRFWTSQISI